MRLIIHLFRTYPLASFLMILALFLSGLVEGLGVSALLPMLKIAMSSGDTEAVPDPPSELEQAVLGVLDWLGVPVTLGALLTLIVVSAIIKAIFLLIAKRQVGYTAAQIATDLRLEVLRNMMHSRWSFFVHQPAGRLSNALATEASRSAGAYMQGATAITLLIQALVYAASRWRYRGRPRCSA